jgi:hypothetical protein
MQRPQRPTGSPLAVDDADDIEAASKAAAGERARSDRADRCPPPAVDDALEIEAASKAAAGERARSDRPSRT